MNQLNALSNRVEYYDCRHRDDADAQQSRINIWSCTFDIPWDWCAPLLTSRASPLPRPGPVSSPNSTEADQHQAFFIRGVQFFGFVFGEIPEHWSHAVNPIGMVLFDFAFVRLFDFVKVRER
jgi:hypothetical protein